MVEQRAAKCLILSESVVSCMEAGYETIKFEHSARFFMARCLYAQKAMHAESSSALKLRVHLGMWPLLGASSADRTSDSAILFPGALVVLAVSLAFSSDFILPKERRSIVQTSSWSAVLPVPVMSEEPTVLQLEAPAMTRSVVLLPPTEAASGVIVTDLAEPEPASSLAETAAAEPAVIVGIAAQEKPPAVITDEVHAYFWDVHQRSPIKRDSAGDFTWKDPAAAVRFGHSTVLEPEAPGMAGSLVSLSPSGSSSSVVSVEVAEPEPTRRGQI
jgi:hypothetical protein